MINTIDSLTPAPWVPSRPTTAASAMRAWRDRLVRLWSPRPPAYEELAALDAHTLADIGAPDRLLDLAVARRTAQQQERDGLQLGLAAGAWHHW